MPRKLSEEEIQLQKDNMYKKTVTLIQEKGLHDLTLEDITEAVPMAKGSFYRYYKTKEEFLYHVIKRNEKEYFDLMMSERNAKKNNKERIRSVMKNSFLSDECLFVYLLPEDLEYLLRRLPKELQIQEACKSHNNFEAFSQLLGLKETDENYATLSYLMDSLQAVLRNPSKYGEAGRKRAARILTDAIADFIMAESETL